MKVKRAVISMFAVLVAAVSFVVVPAAVADPVPTVKGPDHNAVTFCHRTGSLSNPWVIITTDEAAWLEAHQPGSEPGHPPKNYNDDVLIGVNLPVTKGLDEDSCSKGGKGEG